MSVGIIGAGAFGTALGLSLARKGPVDLWARDAEQVAAMRDTREHAKHLPGVPLPGTLRPSADFDHTAKNDILLLAVPMQQLRRVVSDHAEILTGKTLVACCKGVELQSGLGAAAVIADLLPDARIALLTGPSFATDIARGLPTALTLACADEALGQVLQRDLTTTNLRLYRTSDVIGAELGGALKNVIAIACGAVIGAGLGDSARAALLTRGYAEMQRMAIARGARPETLAGLSGLGDLVLTCTSDHSRNYRLGLSLGRGEAFDPSITVEGAATARAVAQEAARSGLDMPITHAVVGLLDTDLTINDAMADLLSRPLKEE